MNEVQSPDIINTPSLIMPWNILFLKTVQMLALSLLQECYCPATFCRWCLIPGYKHGWSVPGLRKSSSGKAHCCCPPLGALWQTHAWPGHQLLPSRMDVSIPPALLTSVLRPRASLYYFDSIPQASLYLFILMPEIRFSCSNSLSLWHLYPDIFTSSNPLLNPVGFLPR